MSKIPDFNTDFFTATIPLELGGCSKKPFTIVISEGMESYFLFVKDYVKALKIDKTLAALNNNRKSRRGTSTYE